jgi:hypothetical protein
MQFNTLSWGEETRIECTNEAFFHVSPVIELSQNKRVGFVVRFQQAWTHRSGNQQSVAS